MGGQCRFPDFCRKKFPGLEKRKELPFLLRWKLRAILCIQCRGTVVPQQVSYDLPWSREETDMYPLIISVAGTVCDSGYVPFTLNSQRATRNRGRGRTGPDQTSIIYSTVLAPRVCIHQHTHTYMHACTSTKRLLWYKLL